MDEDAEQPRGRLRLQRPTFRGSSVGWGIGAVFWLVCAVQALVGVVQDGGTSVVGALLLVGLTALAVVCVIGTVATIRHPRPAPPATDACPIPLVGGGPADGPESADEPRLRR